MLIRFEDVLPGAIFRVWYGDGLTSAVYIKTNSIGLKTGKRPVGVNLKTGEVNYFSSTQAVKRVTNYLEEKLALQNDVTEKL